VKEDTHSFVIRIWQEETDRRGRAVYWKGAVDHVGTGQRLYFSDLDWLVEFIRERTGLEEGKRETLWKRLRRYLRSRTD
jgi:hypothetical protein